MDRDPDGNALIGSHVIDGVRYCFDSTGKMITGWGEVGGKWYYFKADGSMIANDWFRDVQSEAQSGSGQQLWYWFDKNGVMAKGWKLINGKWERFSPSGLWEYTWTGN